MHFKKKYQKPKIKYYKSGEDTLISDPIPQEKLIMKRCLSLPLIASALLAMFIFVGCSAKEIPPVSTTAEAPTVQQESEEKHAEELDSDEQDESSEEVHEESEVAEEETHPEAEPEEAMPMVEIPDGSVLHLIPEHTAGIIYCPSLNELNNRVNMLAIDLMPTAENPEVIAKILANTFGAGFENLAELEEIGLDMDQDFAIFMPALNPHDLSATVHLTDPAAMKQVIDAESEGTAPIKYNGVTYWNAAGGGGSFAIIDNILVFSRTPEVCESVIDTYNKTKPAVTTNPDYSAFLADISEGTTQLAVHFDLESVAPIVSAALMGESEAMKDSLESDPAAMAAAPFFESIFVGVIDLLKQLKSLSATLGVEGTDVKFSPLLRFKSDSEIQKALQGMAPNELTHLGELPSPASMNGAFQGKPELMIEMNLFWLKLISQNANPEQTELLASLTKRMEDFYEALAEEWSFSINFRDSVLPDYLVVYGLKDEQKARSYMEEALIKQLQDSMKIVQNMMGDVVPNLEMYRDAHHGESTMYNGVEIKSYVFPNFSAAFGELPPQAAGLMPSEWHWYYAFTDGYLLMTTGSEELMKIVLDNRAGVGTALDFSEEPSYEKLAMTLGLENNLFFAISPMTLVKTLLPIIAQAADPNSAAALQMMSGMFMNLPENYSIGFSAKVQDDGIGATLLLTLGDFRQLIQTFAMLQGMGQMQ